MAVAGVEMKPLQHVLTVSFGGVGYTSPYILIIYDYHTHSLIPMRTYCCHEQNYDQIRHRIFSINEN